MKALITGASSGIGRDIAIELSKRKYELIIVARDTKKLEEVKQELNTNVKIICMDLSNIDNCKKLYEENKGIDIMAYHILTKLYLQKMKNENKGRIVNVASIAGFMPGPLMATYYSTKSYIVRLSEAIREELKKDKSKVQISILCPGPVNTNFNKVADVQFAIKGQSSEYVARYAVNKFLKGKFYIVPGLKIKLVKIGAKIAPSNFVAKISYRMQKRKIQ